MTGRQIWLSLLAIFVVSSAIAVAVPLVRAGGINTVNPPPASPSLRAVLAVECERADVCDRIVADLLRRPTLTEADRSTARAAVPAIQQALPRATEAECPPPGDACAIRFLPADPDQISAGLAAAGYPDAIVRVARTGDPAPTGAVVFAVPIGEVCVLGYHAPVTGPGDIRIEGQLPGGTCLAGEPG
jgi:hypothetical protein